MKVEVSYTHSENGRMAAPVFISRSALLIHCGFLLQSSNSLLYCAKQLFVLQLLCCPGGKKELLKTAVLGPFNKKTSISLQLWLI